MAEEFEIIHVEQKDTSLYLLTKAEIDTSVATARAWPRSLDKFQKKALSMATLSEEIASSCSYALPRSGKALEGPSIRLAEIVASAYTNVRYGGRVIANDGKYITAQGICSDLENNVSATVEVLRKITDKNGVTYSQDMQVVTGNAAIAIAVRNAIFKVIPSALIEEIYDKAKEVSRGTAETLIVRRDKAVNYFKGLGITDKQLCDTLEVVAINDIDIDKLQVLTGMKASIKNGEATLKTLFEPAGEAEQTKRSEDAKKATDTIADELLKKGAKK
jgi:hypothetical protein